MASAPGSPPYISPLQYEIYRPVDPSVDFGLVTNYGEGGYKTGGGGACEVLPLRKGGTEKI